MQIASPSERSTSGIARVPLLAALFLSGIAGIVNQVVWQRGLKIYLGGSEALSTMTVVLVFLSGLGFGSWLLSRRIASIRRPGRLFVQIEFGLCAVNLLIALLLRLDLSASVFSFQQAALTFGVPLRLTYAVVSLLILSIPCTLMGMTIPLASEICQRHHHDAQVGTISLLFFINTLGAVLGALGSGFLLLPYYGQFISLTIAAAGNGAAALVLQLSWTSRAARLRPWSALRPREVESRYGLPVGGGSSPSPPPPPLSGKPVAEDVFGLLLGLLSLGYQMYLFRLMTLLYWPLPYTFATTLCLFLLFWSLGVFASSRWKNEIVLHGLLAAILVAVMPLLYDVHRWQVGGETLRLVLGGAYFLPCFFFGSLYGQMVSRRAVSWGHDVGLFAATNTAGSCLGIVLFTLVGYEMDLQLNAWIIAVGMLGILGGVAVVDAVRTGGPWRRPLPVPLLAAGVVAALVYHGYSMPFTQHRGGVRSYYGKDGVVELRGDNTMIWDGMEHSRLCLGEEYVGDNNWSLAAVPMMCHRGRPEDALVIGLGCGTTAHALSGVGGLSVDVYDINGTLRKILRDYPEGTFRLAENEQVRIEWRDGRTGLALSPKRYDVITQQPLYLMQAGSGILLSREYFELVRSRLKPGGVFCAYTYDLENGSQSLLVRQTARQVFKHSESFWNGWMIVASDEPIDLDGDRWQAKLQRPGRLFSQIRQHDLVARRRELPTVLQAHDHPRLNWETGGPMVTDNHPLVEYPGVAKRLVRIPRVTAGSGELRR